jgi:hypothetical protein
MASGRRNGKAMPIAIVVLIVVGLAAALIVTSRRPHSNYANTPDDTTEYWSTLKTTIPSYRVTATTGTATIVASSYMNQISAQQLVCVVTFTEPDGTIDGTVPKVVFNIAVGKSVTKSVRASIEPAAPDPANAVPQLDCKVYVNP